MEQVERSKGDAVDVVIAWVDGRDPKHRAKRKRYLADPGGDAKPERVATDERRFSDNEEIYLDLTFRYAFSPAIRARVGARLGWGDETVTLTDSAGTLPTQILDVRRRGIFGGSLSDPLGSPEFTFFIGADFAIGTPAP